MAETKPAMTLPRDSGSEAKLASELEKQMTKKTRRRFTPEYKEQAVARLSDAGVTYASLSEVNRSGETERFTSDCQPCRSQIACFRSGCEVVGYFRSEDEQYPDRIPSQSRRV